METKPLNLEMNLRGQDKFKAIFDNPNKLSKVEQIEKIGKELSKLDKDIVAKTAEYNRLICERAKLISEVNRDKEDARNKN